MSAVLSPSPLFDFPVLSASARLGLKIYPSGNKCGHDPKNPRWLSRLNPYDVKNWDNKSDKDEMGSRRKSHFFYEFDQRISQVYTYPKMMKKFSFHTASGRKKRSEAREAGFAILTVMVHHMNGANRKFGRMPRTREEAAEVGFVYYDNKFLAEKANLSASRTKRGIKWIVKQGYIERKHRHEHNADGSYKGKSSTTIIKDKVFQELGLIDKLQKHYKYSYEKAQAHAKRLGIGISAALNSAIFDVTKFTTPGKKKGDKPGDFPKDDMRHWTCRLPKNKNGQFQSAVAEVMLDSPDMSKAEALQAAFDLIS